MPAHSPQFSSYISSAIAAGFPKYDPPPKKIDSEAAETNSLGKAIQLTPGIASLPAFIVRDTKIPTEDQILTDKGKAELAMDRYLGPRNGLDRGLLNRITLYQLWKKIPILGGLDFIGTEGSMTNEERAFDAAGANDNLPYPHPPPKVKDGSDE